MKNVAVLKENSRQEIKALVLARLETLNRDAKIMLMGLGRPITVRELIEEVEKDSALGKMAVEVQFSFLKMLTGGEI